MLECLTAQNGSIVLRQDGRLLASMVEPQIEATEWLARRSSLIADVRTVFILGAGAGYHIDAVLRSGPGNVVVIEYNGEIVDATKAIHTFPARVHFVCAQKSQQLRGSEVIKSAIGNSHIVLEHWPSISAMPGFYQDCRRLLLGREWGALNWQWRLKGMAPLDASPKISAGQTPLTIYDLEQTELVQNSDERERMLIKALRELVK